MWRWLTGGRRPDGEVELDWISVPSDSNVASRLRATAGVPLRAVTAPFRQLYDRLFGRRVCPICLATCSQWRATCSGCGYSFAVDDPAAALARLEIEWPEPEIVLPDGLPEAFGDVDPELLRLRECADELLAGTNPFAVLRCLAGGRLGGTLQRYPHQIETVRRALGELGGRVLLADEVGLGKTIEAGLILAELRARGLCSRALVLVPPALLDQWEGELAQKLDLPVLRIERPDGWEHPPAIALASLYTARGPRHRERIVAQEWDVVIVDEAHRLRNPRTQLHGLVQALRTRSLLLLTATPLQSSISDVHTLCSLVRPGLLGTPRQFRRRFGRPGGDAGVRNPELLRSVLREVMIRNRRATAGVALPPRRAAIRWFELPPEERALYDAAGASLRAESAGRRGPEPARLAALQRRLASTPAAGLPALDWIADADAAGRLAALAGDIAMPRRVVALAELLRLYPDEQFLVFSEFGESIQLLDERLREWGENVVSWHGRLGGSARQEALDAFRSGRRRVLIGSDALAEGQNLQHCRIVVNFDLPWNPFRIEQRIGRVHRLGQRREVFVLTLAARGTFEETLVRLYTERLHLFELSVGELDPVLGEWLDSEEAYEGMLARIALAEHHDRERELSEFARTLEDGYLRHRTLAGRQDALGELSVVGDGG